MTLVDPSAPTPSERSSGRITKLRYMTWRESTSSTSTLSFRIEGMSPDTGTDLKSLKRVDEIKSLLGSFLKWSEELRLGLLNRIRYVRECLEKSLFFQRREVSFLIPKNK